jgi:hypothetical protein
MIQIDMTPARFAALAAKLKASHGIELNGNKGTLTAHGAKANYSFDGAQLTVNVLHSPFPFSIATAENWLRGQINSN